MPAIDVCFFVERTDRRLADRILEPYLCERAEVDHYQDGYEALTRYVVRLWSVKIMRELFAGLKEAGISVSSDVYFSLPYSDLAEARVYDLIEEFLPSEVIVKKKIYDAFLGSGLWDKIKVLSYDLFLPFPEEEKRAAAEAFAARLRASGIIPDGKHWYVYIPKYLQ